MKAVIIVFDDNGNLMASNVLTPTVEVTVTRDNKSVEDYTFTYHIKKLKRDNNESSGLKIERSFIDENVFE